MRMAAKLRQLTPELKLGLTKAFHTLVKLNLCTTQAKQRRNDLKLFLWGILSRGAGPLPEAAYIDIVEDAAPYRAGRGFFTQDDIDTWKRTVKKYLPAGSPGRQVT